MRDKLEDLLLEKNNEKFFEECKKLLRSDMYNKIMTHYNYSYGSISHTKIIEAIESKNRILTENYIEYFLD